MLPRPSLFVALAAPVLLSSTMVAADAVPAPGGVAALTPQNTKLQFVCAHVGPKPDPRKGSFAKFQGLAKVADKSLQSLNLEIDTASLTTDFDNLTTHLKSPDFFEVRRYPTAKFDSTNITGSGSAAQVTGKLTLHGVTKEITAPANIDVSDAGLKLSSEFTINRTDFGINFDPSKVEKQVTITIAIGN